MILNAHSHLIHEDMMSELFKETLLDNMAKSLNVSKEVLRQNPVVNFAQNANAENYVRVLDDASIDKGLVMGVEYGMSMAGEAKWSVEEINKWVVNQISDYPDKLDSLCWVDPRRGDRTFFLSPFFF